MFGNYCMAIWLARMIDVMGAIAAAIAIDGEGRIDITNAAAELILYATLGFRIRNPLAFVFTNKLSSPKSLDRKTAKSMDFRLSQPESPINLAHYYLVFSQS